MKGLRGRLAAAIGLVALLSIGIAFAIGAVLTRRTVEENALRDLRAEADVYAARERNAVLPCGPSLSSLRVLLGRQGKRVLCERLGTLSPYLEPALVADLRRGRSVDGTYTVDGERLSPAAVLRRLNDLAGANGIGRLDLVENRFVGMKSRGVYETPGGTVLLDAHRAIESVTLDRGAAHLKDELMPRYAELVYNGFWFSPEREMLQALVDKSQEDVTGTVRLKLFKGSVRVVGRKAPASLYSHEFATFEKDTVYDQRDAEGFIKLNALRLRIGALAREMAPREEPR